MDAQRSLTLTTSDSLAEVPSIHRDRGFLAVLSPATQEDVGFMCDDDLRDLTTVDYYVRGEWKSATTYRTPRGDVPASERFEREVKAALVRLRDYYNAQLHEQFKLRS